MEAKDSQPEEIHKKLNKEENKPEDILCPSIVKVIKFSFEILLPLVLSYIAVVISIESLNDSTRINRLDRLSDSALNYSINLSQHEYLFTLHITENNKDDRLEEIKLNHEINVHKNQIFSLIDDSNSDADSLRSAVSDLGKATELKISKLQLSHQISKSSDSIETDKLKNRIETVERELKNYNYANQNYLSALSEYYDSENQIINNTDWLFFIKYFQ
ncbi:TPA: hypothetical protein ACGPBD_000714 [Streptococcus suis]